MTDTVDYFLLTPEDTCLETLSPAEITEVFEKGQTADHVLLNRCALAVLNCGAETDDIRAMLEQFKDFRMEIKKTTGRIELELFHAPEVAFVTYQSLKDGQEVLKKKIIEGIRQHLFALVRDLVFIQTEFDHMGIPDPDTELGITESVFRILRNAEIFQKKMPHKIIVCWGGHSIGKREYDYSVAIGHECGLRLMDVITGCGPGAMRGPMEGAILAHAKQRLKDARYIGLSEPGIIAAEPPNPIVNNLVIFPDIEKRLEAFIRLGQGVIVFPGGAGTTEEIMFILGIMTHPDNQNLPFPLILTGPESSRDYFTHLDRFLRDTLGREIQGLYDIIVDDPGQVARTLNQGLLQVKAFRDACQDSYYFNRSLKIPAVFQEPFDPTHENVARLDLARDQETWMLAANLRRAFSAIVAGNVKPDGIRAVETLGPFKIHGDPMLTRAIDDLLRAFIDQGRMRLKGEYIPCYCIAD